MNYDSAADTIIISWWKHNFKKGEAVESVSFLFNGSLKKKQMRAAAENICVTRNGLLLSEQSRWHGMKWVCQENQSQAMSYLIVIEHITRKESI